jgi:hypothetical protein
MRERVQTSTRVVFHLAWSLFLLLAYSAGFNNAAECPRFIQPR